MIAFATLLLGLIVGPQPVELLVGESVAYIEVSLDGRAIRTLERAPWSLTCDFGPQLEPHELVAVAFDVDHNEVGRARQRINMPRHPAEAALALEGGRDGTGLIAHLAWESVVDSEPVSVTASFDGIPVQVTNPRRIELPSFDTRQLHHFRAEIEFAGNVSSVVETTFAGAYVDRVNTELTAIAVQLDKRTDSLSPGSLSGSFTTSSKPLDVMAIEKGPAEVIVVRDEDARRDLSRLHRHDQEALWRRARGGRVVDRVSARTKMPLPHDLKLRFLWPISDRQKRSGYDLDVFPPSKEFTSRDGGLFWLLTYVRQPLGRKRTDRYADAVAAAGLLAAGRNRRRAVVLLLKDQSDSDSGQFELPEVRSYLGDLGVPLLIWSTSPARRLPGQGGGITDVSSLGKLERASKDLFEILDRQRIVWLDGTHLPQDIDLDYEGLSVRPFR